MRSIVHGRGRGSVTTRLRSLPHIVIAMDVDVMRRNNVTVGGDAAGRPMVFAHGFGCDQHMWRFVEPVFADLGYRTVRFDYVGAGASDLGAYSADRYASLDGYARDVIDVVEALDLHDAVFVGHSVSSMVGVLAADEVPARIGALVMIGPSPRYLNEVDYIGGFTTEDIEGLLTSLDSNYLGWSASMAPVIAGNPDRPEIGAELTDSFCRTDPDIQKRFARVTFLADNRDDLAKVRVPTLVLQCSDDVIAPDAVGAFVHERIAGSTFTKLRATGHCPHLSAPEETAAAIAAFLGHG
jgi:sigma-B regulation protein RsbQ